MRSISLAQRHNATLLQGDGPLVVLQHGFGTDQSVWRHVLPVLQGRFSVLTLNLAGAGPDAAQTYEPNRYDELESYADDLLLVLNELGVEECSYVGASAGAMVGMLAAVEQPSKFRKLIAIGASARYLDDEGYIGGFQQTVLDALYESMSADYHGWVTGFAPYVVRGVARQNAQVDSAVQEFCQSLLSLRPDIALSAARAIFQSDYRRVLPLIDVPTVLLQTEHDAAVPLSAAEYLRDHIRGAVLEILPAEGHFPHLSAPTVVAEALLRHLA